MSVNPRYEVYASVHGETPASMLAADIERWPGGKMAGFSIWISQQWAAWRGTSGVGEHWETLYATEFDEWLSTNAKPLQLKGEQDG